MSAACHLAAAETTPEATTYGDTIGGEIHRAWDRATSGDAWAGPGHWRGLISPYTLHYRYSEEHKPVYAIGIERQSDDRWLAGGAYFSNSFGQPSAYVYVGHRSEIMAEHPELFFQWSLGVIYGYVGKYQDKVPMNVKGFAPGAVVSLGWQLDRHASVSVHALGDAGLMLQLAYDFR